MAEKAGVGKYRIGVVSKITGISQHALRVWERRYGTFGPARSEAGGRLYSDAEISRFVLIRKLQERGHAIGRLAKLPAEELERILGAYQPAEPPPLPSSDLADIRRRFLSAINMLDLQQAEQILQRAAATLNARTLVIEFLAPIVEEIGSRWERGDFRVFHEHAATALLRNLIATQLRAYSPGANAHVAVVATPSGEYHEFGALLVSLLIASRGWRAIYLGTSLPAADVTGAVAASAARYLFISISGCRQNDLSGELAAMADGVSRDVKIVLGGAGAMGYRNGYRNTDVVTDILDFERWLDSH